MKNKIQDKTEATETTNTDSINVSGVVINVQCTVTDIQMIIAGLQSSELRCRDANRISELFKTAVNAHFAKEKEVKK